MTKILVECPELIASVRVGVLNALKPFGENRRCDVRFRRTMDIRKKDIKWCDILICVRGFSAINERLVKIAKDAGRFCVYFLDDDLGDMPLEIPSADFTIKSNAKEHIQEILRHSDVLWTVNGQLCAKYRQWCGRAITARVPTEAYEFSAAKFDDARIGVLYAGSTDHGKMVREQLSPAIRRIAKEYPDRFRFTFIGADPGLSDLENVEYIPFIESYDRYREIVGSGRYTIGLAPLKSGYFYECKYYNKFIEYASMGIVGIYADRPPYTLVARHRVNGFLCADTPQGWYEAILSAADDRALLKDCALRAREMLKADFSSDAVARDLEERIPELVSYRAPKRPVKWRASSPVIECYKERIIYNFRRYGPLAVIVLFLKLIRMLWKYYFFRKGE